MQNLWAARRLRTRPVVRLFVVTISRHLDARSVIVNCQAVGFDPCFQHRAGEDKNGFKTELRNAWLTGEDLLALGGLCDPAMCRFWQDTLLHQLG